MAARRGGDGDAAAGLLPLLDLFAEAQVGSGAGGELEVCAHGQFGPGEARLLFVQADEVRLRREIREGPPDFGGVHDLVRQGPFPGGADTARDREALGRADIQAAGEAVHLVAGVPGELRP